MTEGIQLAQKTMKIKLPIIFLAIVMIIAGGWWIGKKRTIIPNNKIGQAPVTVRVAYGPYVSPIFIAFDKGFFEEERLDVEKQLVPGTDTTTIGLTNGDIDTAWIPYSVLFSFEQAAPGNFKIFSNAIETLNKPYSYLIVKSNIGNIKDLLGKKIVVRSGINGRLQAEMILKGLGVDLKKIELVQVEAPITPIAFAKEDVSAAIDVEPSATAMLQRRGGKILESAVRVKYITDPYSTGAQVFSSKFIQAHPKEAEKFRLAFEKAVDYMKENDQESRDILQKYLKLDSEVAKAMAPQEIQKYAEIDRNSITKLMEISVETKQLDRLLNLSSIYYEP